MLCKIGKSITDNFFNTFCHDLGFTNIKKCHIKICNILVWTRLTFGANPYIDFILSSQLNLFVRDALALLLSPDLPLTRLSERLQPILDFLSDNLSALANWLYRDAFRRVLQFIWLYIVQVGSLSCRYFLIIFFLTEI